MNVTNRMVMVGAAAALALAGCSGDGGGASGVNGCHLRAAGLCVTYSAQDPESVQEAEATCTAAGGAWEPCPSTALAGTCQLTQGDEPFLTFHYYAGFICSPEEGQARCSAHADPELGQRTTFTQGEARCGPTTDRTLTCDRSATERSCVTASGAMAPERVALFEGMCAQDGAVAEACPSGAVATCVSTEVGGEVVTERYYPGAELDEAELECAESGGTWSGEQTSVRAPAAPGDGS